MLQWKSVVVDYSDYPDPFKGRPLGEHCSAELRRLLERLAGIKASFSAPDSVPARVHMRYQMTVAVTDSIAPMCEDWAQSLPSGFGLAQPWLFPASEK